ncbi:MAG: hypothetical protein AB1486_16150 [Planctomycetota bacterium]
MKHSLARLFLQSVALAPALLGCGSGTMAIIDASSGDGGGAQGNQLTEVRELWLEDPDRRSPATIRWVLADQESDRADVMIVVYPGEHGETLVEGGLLRGLRTAPGPGGVPHRLKWHYAAAFGDGFTPDVPLGIKILSNSPSGREQDAGIDRQLRVNLENESSSVTRVECPTAESSGIVAIELTVEDSSADVLSIRVEYSKDDGVSWQLARPATQDDSPEFAIEGVLSSPSGTDVTFFWDTNIDLETAERDVLLRFTPFDGVLFGDAAETMPFRVDNNREPDVDLNGAAFLSNPDQCRGIPIPFSLADEESDLIRLVFQWRRPDETYPDLPTDPLEVEKILADPALRRQMRIATEYEVSVSGRIFPVSPSAVRLPELAAEAATILPRGVEGLELEILRDSSVPRRVAESWQANPLQQPVAVLPVDDGISALVLDFVDAADWRLREIHLGTGRVIRAIASGPGSPDTMTFEPSGNSVLVAVHEGSDWRVYRVGLQNSVVTLLADGSVTSGVANIRGMAPLCGSACLITVGDSLLRLDYANPSLPSVVSELENLQKPWGIVIDPIHPNQIYLAERDWENPETGVAEGRVVSFDLGTRALSVVTSGEPRHRVLRSPRTTTGLASPLRRPQGLALERSGSRLVLITDIDPRDGWKELRTLDFGRVDMGDWCIAVAALPDDAESVFTGPQRVRLVPLKASDDRWSAVVSRIGPRFLPMRPSPRQRP